MRLIVCMSPFVGGCLWLQALIRSSHCRFLPKNVSIIGYARSKLNIRDLRATVAEHLKGATEDVSRFLDLISYLSGTYDSPPGFQVRQPRRGSQGKRRVRATLAAAAPVSEHCLARRRCKLCWRSESSSTGHALPGGSSTWPCRPQFTRRCADMSCSLTTRSRSLVLSPHKRAAVSRACQHCCEGQVEAEVARRFAGA